MRALITIFFLILLHSQVQGQSVNWTAFAHLNDSLRQEQKPVLIFIHTDWCKFCQLQDNTTFADPELTQVLNKNFYCLRLNAESKADISFLNRTYKYKLTGYHELAELLAKQNGTFSFPATLVLDHTLQPVKRYTGYVSAADLKSLIGQIYTLKVQGKKYGNNLR